MPVSFQIKVDAGLYLKDPQESTLGKKIIGEGVLLLDAIGLEAFTFKKLAERIGCTEATLYRYFENKYYFLLYILAWYWEWVRVRIDFNTMNVQAPRQRLRLVISTIVDTVRLATPASYMDRDALNRVVVADGPKAYHTKEVDEQNKNGFFNNLSYLNKKITSIILENNPNYQYPKALASSMLEMVSQQLFFSQHLPELTEVKVKNGNYQEIEQVLEQVVFGALGLAKE